MESAIRRQRLPMAGIVVLVLFSILSACSDGNDTVSVVQKPQAANPTIEGPISGGGAADCCIIMFGPLDVDLRTQGYATLYPDKQAYINAIDGATNSAVAAGFVRPADADLINDRARTSPLPLFAWLPD